MEGLPQERLKGSQQGQERRFAAAVIGASAGGISAVSAIVSALPPTLPLPVIVVLHQSPQEPLAWVDYLGRHASLPVVEAEDKMPLCPGTVYCAPAGYHLLLETNGDLALSVDEKINFSRPSIDLLFSSAADVFGPALIGIVLTGANSDGARGLAEIVGAGGLAMVQAPAGAEWPTMPEAALQTAPQAWSLGLDEIADQLVALSMPKQGLNCPASKGA
jgi:two-component system chemotaxis response regulator CheB